MKQTTKYRIGAGMVFASSVLAVGGAVQVGKYDHSIRSIPVPPLVAKAKELSGELKLGQLEYGVLRELLSRSGRVHNLDEKLEDYNRLTALTIRRDFTEELRDYNRSKNELADKNSGKETFGYIALVLGFLTVLGTSIYGVRDELKQHGK